ncbi:MAG: DUF1523 family protein [Rhodobacteraceae bacterium]|jgi:hypothetical protein|nr:DUF1523 family protein [Paracoccaceae bacterium]
MRRIKTFFRILVFVLLGSLLHYVLPQHDIVRVTSTEIIRTDFSTANRWFYAQADSGNVDQPTRDLRLINTVRKRTMLFGLIKLSDATMVYRNEDTGWIWPPYFKFDSSDLQAEAGDSVSTEAAPKWMVMTHYGWRNRFFTIYPNAVSLRPASGPDERIIPYFNIGFFAFLIVAWLFLRAMWAQFRERSLDPALDKASNTWDEVEANVSERKSRIGRWLDTWRRK